MKDARPKPPDLSLVSPFLRSGDTLEPPERAETGERAGAGAEGPDFPAGRAELTEVFASGGDAGAIGFALAQLPAGKPLLWVQDRLSAFEAGRPHGGGLKRFGADPDRLVLVCARDAGDVLWTMEEGLKCAALGGVIGEVWGAARALDFTASKRLALRAERTGIPVTLLRFSAPEDLSAARRRWRVTSLPSAPHPGDPKAPGAPRWRAELFRARDRTPGVWEAEYDGAAHRLRLAPTLPDPALAPAQLRAASG